MGIEKQPLAGRDAGAEAHADSSRTPTPRSIPTPDPIPAETVRRLHRRTLPNKAANLRLLKRACAENAVLRGGISRMSEKQFARIAAVGEDQIELESQGFSTEVGRQLAFNFALAGEGYFFVARVLAFRGPGSLVLAIPQAIHLAEGREQLRVVPGDSSRVPQRVEILTTGSAPIQAEVVDWSYQGMAVNVPEADDRRLGTTLRLRSPEGGAESHGRVRYRGIARERRGWVRLGLSVSQVPTSQPIAIEVHDRIPVRDASLPGEGLAPLTSRPVGFRNSRGESLVGVVDSWGDPQGATAVVLTPAWGRTKESLLPLALTIVESFRRSGLPVVVMRFDGTRRRGESYVPRECRRPGCEHLRFNFSQAVEDTRSALRFLRCAPEYRTGKAILVTSSLSSVEARRLVADDRGADLAGWISIVGVGDLQSALHIISGGVDFGYGLLKGLQFGCQELFGVLVDIDLAGGDALEHGLAFFEDARRDMVEINVPVTWVHGQFDAWVDLERVRSLMSCGDTANRRLLSLPIGHQLRSSGQAFDVFRLVAQTAAEMSLGESIDTCRPGRHTWTQRRKSELRRVAQPESSLAGFWREFLLGRHERLGSKMLTSTDAYRQFMDRQVGLLGLQSTHRVADLGAGTGEFALRLRANSKGLGGLRVHALDFVREVLTQASGLAPDADRVRVHGIVADLEAVGSSSAIPFASQSYDAVLASLLISYLEDPAALLSEIHRILRPSGVAVISSLKRDADISKLYVDAFADRYSERPAQVFGAQGETAVDRSLPSFLNTASRIISLEDQGRFRFFEPEELMRLMRGAGFRDVDVHMDLGNPPQAVIARGRPH